LRWLEQRGAEGLRTRGPGSRTGSASCQTLPWSSSTPPPGLDLAMGSPARAARPDPARKTRAWAEICWPDTRAGPGLGSPKTEIKPTARPAARRPGGLGVFLAGPGRAWAKFFCVGPTSGRPEARPGPTHAQVCLGVAPPTLFLAISIRRPDFPLTSSYTLARGMAQPDRPSLPFISAFCFIFVLSLLFLFLFISFLFLFIFSFNFFLFVSSLFFCSI
jgi:hypothetical protein